jgi:hypothetical protein
MAALGITTPVLKSSQVLPATALRGQDRVIALCSALGATTYVNPIGGTTLYSSGDFLSNGMSLQFLHSNLSPYPQSSASFEAALSIIDVIAYCGRAQTTTMSKTDYVIVREEDRGSQ